MHCNNTQMLQLPRGALLRLPRVPCTKGENPCEPDQIKNVHASCSCLQGSQDHPPPKGDHAGAPARTGVEDHHLTQQLSRRRPRSTPHPQTEEEDPHHRQQQTYPTTNSCPNHSHSNGQQRHDGGSFSDLLFIQ
ncbi:hypothetical protein ACOMHN_051294 [Nucella lapillus]